MQKYRLYFAHHSGCISMFAPWHFYRWTQAHIPYTILYIQNYYPVYFPNVVWIHLQVLKCIWAAFSYGASTLVLSLSFYFLSFSLNLSLLKKFVQHTQLHTSFLAFIFFFSSFLCCHCLRINISFCSPHMRSSNIINFSLAKVQHGYTFDAILYAFCKMFIDFRLNV